MESTMTSATIRVIGGLGNQLHCYAFGRAVSVRNNVNVRYDVESGFWNDPYRREYLLDQFPRVVVSERRLHWNSPIARIFFKSAMKFFSGVSRIFPMSTRMVVVEEVPRRYQKEIHDAKYVGCPYFSGYWASYRYYVDIEAELRQELEPPMPADPSVLAVLAHIQSVESCFVHWRSYKEVPSSQVHEMRSYYSRAIEVISERHQDVVFFIFSDDPKTVKSEISLPSVPTIYVDLAVAKGNRQSLADLYLMFSCKHAIIGDSTFSWWAAWLGDQRGKTVVGPRGLSPWGDDWMPPHWIALDVKEANI